MARTRVLVVDDEQSIREVVRECLQSEYDITEASDGVAGLDHLLAEVPDVLVTDVKMPGGDGLELCRHALRHFPDLAVVVITGHGSIEDFVRFFRLGVADYVLKPFTPAELSRAIVRALATRRIRSENARLRETLASEVRARLLRGESPALREVLAQIDLVGPTEATVLITGASGSGKELAARTLHDRSRRAAGPFIAVHCGALSPELLESELFGHVRGAFSGADRARAGRFEEASGGTLFLDEVGTMTESAQVRLLRALDLREVTRVGESTPRKVDVRIVAATNADLEGLVAGGKFRRDLLFRLNVFPLKMPLLAERMTDMPLLAQHFVHRACTNLNRRPMSLSQDAMRKLMAHDWPGNVRELENAVERAVILSEGDVIEASDLVLGRQREPTDTDAKGTVDIPAGGMDLAALLDCVERNLIEQAMTRCEGNKQRAADLLGLGRTTLVQKLRRRADATTALTPPDETD